MRLQQSIYLLVVFLAYATAFSLSSIFGGGTEITTADEVLPEATLDLPENTKPIKPVHKPQKPHLKPVKPHKPVIVKKPVNVVSSKIKKIKDLKKKKVSFFTHLALPFFSLHKQKPLTSKLVPIKTEYVEVTKRITVHPVCYITLKKKPPCIKPKHHADPTNEEAKSDGQNLEVEVDKGYLDEEEEETWPWNRQSKGIEESLEINESEETTGDEVWEDTAVEDVFDNVEVRDEDATARLTYTVDVAEEELAEDSEDDNRRGRYIDFAQPADASAEDYTLESSEDVEGRIKKLAWATKTVLVTRIERYTDTKVTATVIAKNCAPVTPNVPKCPKKKATHAVIRERPDYDVPLTIESTPSIVATPPQVVFHAKEIIDDQLPEATNGEMAEESAPLLTVVEKA